jgi:hypothetical protein
MRISFFWIIVKCFNGGKYIEFYSVVKHYFFLRAAFCNSIEQICLVKLILASSLPSQEIPEFYGTCKFISVHKSLSLGPILSQMNPVRTLPYCLFKFSFNILAIPRSSQMVFSFMFPHQNSVALYKFCEYLLCESGKNVINAHYGRTFLYYCSLYITYIEGDEIFYYYVGE